MSRLRTNGCVQFTYENYRGEISVRTVEPMDFTFRAEPPWYPEPRWLLRAYDHGKSDYRSFDMAKIKDWTVIGQEDVS